MLMARRPIKVGSMKVRILIALATVPAFLLGMSVSSAYATSAQSGWYKIFGHSTSCGLGVASINPATNKVGGVTENRDGCSHSYEYRAVPARYLGIRTLLVRQDTLKVCGDSGLAFNPTTDESITRTVAWQPREGCPLLVDYFSETSNYRDTDNDGRWRIKLLSPTRQL